MDQAGIGMFYETVSRMRAQYDLSILLVSHDLMAAAVVADRMVLLDRTVLCDGSPREVLLDPAIRRTFGFAVNEQDLTGRPTELGRLPREHCQQAPGGVS
jgi:zinc transport system ATP-binding protein